MDKRVANLVWVGLALSLLQACSTTRAEARTEATAPRSEAALVELMAAHDDAWNAHDPQALSALFARAGTLVTPQGKRVTGRTALTALFSSPGPTRGTTSRTTLDDVQWLDDDTVLIDATQTLSAPAGADATRAPLDGATARLVGVVRRVDGRWRFVAARPFLVNGPR